MRLLPLCFLILTAPLLVAQQPTPSPTPTPTRITMWRCNLPGGSYSVALRDVVSVSSHEYVVEGAVRVTEVNIDTQGNALARFYYLEPAAPNAPDGLGTATLEKAQQLLQEASERTGQDVWKKVVKNYPTSTHAHTIEYRVEDKATLTRLYESAESALRLNQNLTFNSK
jgi:hypothetical protein